MKEKPILFNGEMVRAVLDGRKTQTRRVVKGSLQAGACGTPKKSFENNDPFDECLVVWDTPNPRKGFAAVLPYRVGDRLWVREAISRRPASLLGIEATNGVETAFYVADGSPVLNKDDFDLCPWWDGKSLPSIHMPRWASRITLEITDVRVQRVTEISEDDAKAEGCVALPAEQAIDFDITPGGKMGMIEMGSRYRYGFQNLWEGINAKRGFGWSVNPWIWAITFRRLTA